MTIKAVGFDLDDTLYDRDEIYKQVYNVMEASMIKSNTNFQEFNKVYQQHSLIEYDLYVKQLKSKEDYLNDRIINTYRDFGIKITKEQAVIFNALYNYLRIDFIKLRAEVLPFIKNLSKNNIKIFILTNGPSNNQLSKIKALDLLNYFKKEDIFISDDLGIAKPNPQVFNHIAEKINYQPEEILYIGDNLVNDIEGCLACGWKAMYLDIENSGLTSDRFTSISDFSQIKNILDLKQGELLIKDI